MPHSVNYTFENGKYTFNTSQIARALKTISLGNLGDHSFILALVESVPLIESSLLTYPIEQVAKVGVVTTNTEDITVIEKFKEHLQNFSARPVRNRRVSQNMAQDYIEEQVNLLLDLGEDPQEIDDGALKRPMRAKVPPNFTEKELGGLAAKLVNTPLIIRAKLRAMREQDFNQQVELVGLSDAEKQALIKIGRKEFRRSMNQINSREYRARQKDNIDAIENLTTKRRLLQKEISSLNEAIDLLEKSNDAMGNMLGSHGGEMAQVDIAMSYALSFFPSTRNTAASMANLEIRAYAQSPLSATIKAGGNATLKRRQALNEEVVSLQQRLDELNATAFELGEKNALLHSRLLPVFSSAECFYVSGCDSLFFAKKPAEKIAAVSADALEQVPPTFPIIF